jgi:methyl-accepting chemotaxis protein
MNGRIRRGIALGAVLLAYSTSALGADALRLWQKEWRLSAGDDPAKALPGYDDSSWKTVALPGTLGTGKRAEVFWLRARFKAPEDSPGRLYFLSGKGGVAFELYVDGQFAGARGSLPPDYDLRATHTEAFLLPAAAAKGGAESVLALRCAYLGESASAPAFSIGDTAAKDFDLGAANFWNGRLYLILSALCLFLGLSAFAQFVFKTSERAQLYFAITLVFMAFYLLDLGAESWPIRAPWARALSRASLGVSMMFLIPFFTTFFGFLQRRWLGIASLGTAIAVVAAFLAVAGNDSSLGLVFNISLLPVMASIFFCAYMCVRALRAGQKEAWPVLVAVIVGVALASYDSYHTVVGTEPFAWLEGLAFFALNVSIYIALSMRQAKLKSDIETYAAELESNKARLDASLARLGEAGAAAAALSRKLDEAAGAASRTAEEAARRGEKIGLDTERQAKEAREADSLVADFAASIGRVNGSLASQAESVERTAAAAAQLTAGAESVARSVEGTASIAKGLAELTVSGEGRAAALWGAVDRISASSAGIGEVVEAVNEFAEKTNLLAMNAAIEAAHSGASGRGFAIIAGEVKKLAQAQTERAARIKLIVAEIALRVGEGSRDAEALRSAFREIAAGSAEAAERLEEVRRGAEEQKRGSEDIIAAMEALAASGSSIRDEAARQAEYSGKVKAVVAEIAEAAAESRESSRAIVREGAALVSAVTGLRELTSKGSELTAALSAKG